MTLNLAGSPSKRLTARFAPKQEPLSTVDDDLTFHLEISKHDIPSCVKTKSQHILHTHAMQAVGDVQPLQGTRPYTIEEYRKIGRKRFKEIFGDVKDPGEKTIEAEFWHKASSNRFSVQYGSDVEGTAVGFASSPHVPRCAVQWYRNQFSGPRT